MCLENKYITERDVFLIKKHLVGRTVKRRKYSEYKKKMTFLINACNTLSLDLHIYIFSQP